MPPHQAEERLLLATGMLSSSSFDENNEHSSSFRRSVSPSRASMTILSLGQPTLLKDYSNTALVDDEDVSGLTQALRQIEARMQVLRDHATECVQTAPAGGACTIAYRTRMPFLLSQATLLLDTLGEKDHDSEYFVRKLRARFALLTASQYLDTIESILSFSAANPQLNEQMTAILQQAQAQDLVADDDFRKALEFRVSHGPEQSLAFDLPAGRKATQVVQGDGVNTLPLTVEVEPVIVFSADDILNRSSDQKRMLFCKVEIESCKHDAVPADFSEGAGRVGVALVRVRLSPLEQDLDKRKGSVWGKCDEGDIERLRVKGARAVQVNTFQGLPKPCVDLYTSSFYGDAGITVTMIIKTFKTAPVGAATPAADSATKLHVELFLDN